MMEPYQIILLSPVAFVALVLGVYFFQRSQKVMTSKARWYAEKVRQNAAETRRYAGNVSKYSKPYTVVEDENWCFMRMRLCAREARWYAEKAYKEGWKP